MTIKQAKKYICQYSVGLSTELTVYITHQKKKAYGQLVVLGFDVSIFTPAPYQRCRLQRP